MTTYPGWALAAFRERIAPVLASAATDEVAARWVESCGPGDDERTRFRLFPGSLYLLWLEALGAPPSTHDAGIAAALECLHNASLHHDDVLDAHDSRRGVGTLRAAEGTPAALLAGDGLVGLALRLVSSHPTADRWVILEEMATAWLRVTQGQRLDEPETWRSISPAARADHWERMTRLKLALGNVAAPLAALSAGRRESAPAVAALHERFSIVSQIMNDVGDLAGWAGFHVVAPCRRAPRSETDRKPTILTIWGPAIEGHSGAPSAALLARADAEIARRTAEAQDALEGMTLDPAIRPVLVDFFTRPLDEFRCVTAGARDAR
jgi:hypothetical protein